MAAVGFVLLSAATAAAREATHEPGKADDECALSIQGEGLDEAWASELEAVRTALARRDDVDTCATIVLDRVTAGTHVIVILKDGRSAERTLLDPRDLRAVVTALILLPAPREPSTTVTPIARDEVSIASPKPPTSHRRPRFSLGGVGGSRWSGAAPAGAVGLFADVRLDDWAVGAHGRWDDYAATSALVGYTTQVLEFGADVGRDFRVGATSLTVLAGPRFALLSQTLQSTPPPVNVAGTNPKTGEPIGSVRPSARDGKVLRVGGTVRWHVLALRPMTLFLGADAEVDVMPDAGNRVPSAFAATNPLPIWSAGLSLGGEVAVWP
jgi:hypothetical protein